MSRTLRTSGFALTFLAGMSASAFAETHVVKMLNKGVDGKMVFESAFVLAVAGDTVKFIAVDSGHNVFTIEGMLPEGAKAIAGKLNESISVTLTVEGIYGVKCAPHYEMGMVGLIQVGAPTNIQSARSVVQTGVAKPRFDAMFAQINQ